MKVMVIGSGGREHALVWGLSRSRQVERIYSATSNAGILKLTLGANVSPSDPDALVEFALREGIGLVVIGPEQPLVEGLGDRFSERGMPVFGPSRSAARLEGSKVFAKEFMDRHAIPTAGYRVVDTAAEGFDVLKEESLGYPLVIKADGLAAGKGVIIAGDEKEARSAIEDLMVDRRLGDAGSRVLIEECLIGRELSYLVFSDGKNYLPMPVAQDHKRAYDGDHGPNTGGMGAFSTTGLLDPVLEDRIRKQIVEPTLEGARRDGFPFRGVLYCGLMLTKDGPRVLEYNVRFGDPETQTIFRRLESDFAEIALAVATGGLERIKPQWSDQSSICVVLASAGYPGEYLIGKPVTGIEEAEKMHGIVVFHAGTRTGADRRIETAGGRVLGVTARAETLDQAVSIAYEAVGKISFEGMQYRKDIGRQRK